MNDSGIQLGDGVCGFEKVLPDQVCPSSKKLRVRGTVRVRLRVRDTVKVRGTVRVRVRVRVSCFVVRAR